MKSASIQQTSVEQAIAFLLSLPAKQRNKFIRNKFIQDEGDRSEQAKVADDKL